MADSYGVLLPLHLETRFIPPGESAERPGENDPAAEPERWRLRLRVLPDEPSIDLHEPTPTVGEIAHVQGVWDTLRLDPLPSDSAARLAAASALDGWTDAFARLAAATGPARAAWLFAHLDVSLRPDGRPLVSWRGSPATETHPRIVGLPGRLDVWAVWTGTDVAGSPAPAPELLGALHPEPVTDSLDLGAVGATGAAGSTGAAADRPWWTSWEAAVRSGLAAEILLPRHPEEIEVLGVSGLGPGDGATPEELFRAHTAAGRFAVLRPGVPTSTAYGAETVDTDRLDHWADPAAKPGHGAEAVVRALTGAGDVGPVPADPLLADHRQVGRLILSACFPALWGYGLAGVLNLPRRAEAIGDLWEWAQSWLCPEGPYPPVQVGDQVYAVLPLAVPSGEVAEGLASEPTARWEVLHPILPALGRIARHWASAARRRPRAGRGPDEAARTLLGGPVPSRLRWRPLVPAVLDAAAHGEPAVQAMEAWFDTHRPAAEVLGLDQWRQVGRAYLAAPRDYPLTMSLIGPGLDTPDEVAPELGPLLEWLWRYVTELDVDGTAVPLPEVGADLARPVDNLLLTLYRRSLYVVGQLLWLCGQPPPKDPAHRLELLEPLAALRQTRAFRQTSDFVAAPHGECHSLLRAASAARPDGVEAMLKRCYEVPATRTMTTRALRAVVDASTGRWDAWLAGVGAAHAADALDSGAVPTLGAYGWVDTPFRGVPGPGPGGFLLAPSQNQAATLAVLRDVAVRDPDPARYAMNHASGLVGPARRWLADVGQGWHPAELTGRLLERRIGDRDDLAVAEIADLLGRLRAEAPLREDQGGFGCTHGLDALAYVREGRAGVWSHPAITEEAARVDAILDVASDLLLAEGVHGFLHGLPNRSAGAVRALAGKAAPQRLSVLEPDRPSYAVQTCVLVALRPAQDTAQATGPAGQAVPALDAALRRSFPAALAWRVEVGEARYAVSLDDLGCAPLDVATLDEPTVQAMCRLAVAAGRGTPVSGPEQPADVLAPMRAWCRRVAGRPAEVADLKSGVPAAEDGQGPTDTDVEERGKATRLLLDRIATLRTAAEALAAELEATHQAMLSEESARLAAVPPGEAVPPLPSGRVSETERRLLAGLAVRAASWGFPPPDCTEQLLGGDDREAHRARADLGAYLGDCARRLRARVEAVLAVPVVAADTVADATLIARTGHPATVASALAELTGRPGLPVGSRLRFGSGLRLEPSGEALDRDWAPTIAAVRPHLRDVVVARPEGLRLFATNAADPWRLGALAALGTAERTSPLPRLTVVLAADMPAAGSEYDWITVDGFGEAVPDATPHAGAAFDTATPAASPPQAILLAPAPRPGSGGPTDEELRALVCYARMLAHGRMAESSALTDAGLGPLTSWAALPQDRLSGAPLNPAAARDIPTPDLPAVLTSHQDDASDVVTAVTGDPLWMLGAQWRLGEHAGEDASTPLWIDTRLSHAPIRPSPARPGRDPRRVPFEACLEGEPGEAERYAVPAAQPPPPGGHWVPPGLEYEAAFPVGPETSGNTLRVARHNGGPADWWAMRAGVEVRPDASTEPLRARPGRLEWPGRPKDRYWQIERPHEDPAGSGPDRTQPATLHLLAVLAQHGRDLFVAPLPARAGTVLRPGTVTMTDAAGGTWVLRPPTDWSLMRVDGLDPEPPKTAGDDPEARWQRGIPILLDAETALTGPPLDDIAIAGDEDDNLVWAAELRVDGLVLQDPPGTGLTRPQDNDTFAGAEWTWDLGGRIPRHRHPFVHGSGIAAPAQGAGQDVFVRGRLADPDVQGGYAPDPSSVPLAETTRLRPLAVPASGVRLIRQPVLARATDGSPLLWLRRTTRPLDVPVDVDLRWDTLRRAAPE